GVLLAPDGIDGAVPHVDDLGAVNDVDAAIIAADAFEFRLQSGGIPGEVEARDFRQFGKGKGGTLDEFARPFIVAHGVQRDFHNGSSGNFSICEGKWQRCGHKKISSSSRAGGTACGREEKISRPTRFGETADSQSPEAPGEGSLA